MIYWFCSSRMQFYQHHESKSSSVRCSYMVSTNPNSKFKSFMDFWPIRNKWIPTLICFDHKKPLSKLEIGETMAWKFSLFLFAPAPWATSLKPWIWWNIWIIWSSSYRVSSGNQNWSWLRIVSYQSWFVNVWSPKLSKKFLKRYKKWKN